LPKTKTHSKEMDVFQAGLIYYVDGLGASMVVAALVPLLVNQYAQLLGLLSVRDILATFILVIVTVGSFFAEIHNFSKRESNDMLSGIFFILGVGTISYFMKDWLELCAVVIATILVVYYRLQDQAH
jgi:hypothetical protein